MVERALFVGVMPAPQIAMYAYETLLTKLTQARRDYVASVRSGKRRSAYSPKTAGDHFAIAWVSVVHGKIHELVPEGEEDPAIEQCTSGRDLVKVESQDKALIEKHGIWIERGWRWAWLARVSRAVLDRQPGDTRADAA